LKDRFAVRGQSVTFGDCQRSDWRCYLFY